MAAESSNPAAIEAALRTQERQLAMIFNSAREMMMLVRVEPGVLFRVVSVNREYLNKVQSVGFRFTAEDFAGKTCDEVIGLFGFPAAAVASIRARYEQVIESRQLLAYEENKSGPAGVFHGRTTITPILDETGACAFVLYATQDITAWKLAEEERTRSEQTLRAILDHTFQFIGLLDPAGRLLRPNQTSLDAVGARREDVEGKFFWETPWWAHSPAEQQRLREAVGRAAQGEFVRFETSHPAKDGRLLTIDFSLKPVRGEDGQVIMIIPEGRDITEQKAAAQALHESEEKFATAFRLSPNAMSIVSLEDGRYLEINQGHQEIFGYPPDEIIGRTPAELGMLVDPSVTAAALEQLRARGRVRDLTVVLRTRGGELRTVLNSAELVHVSGRECGLLTSRDITDRLRAEQALRESEEKFAKAFVACPDAMSVHELESGRYVDVNEGFLRLFGYAREEVVGRTPLELGLWAETTGRQSFVEQLRKEGRVRDYKAKVRVRDGRERVCKLSAEKIEIGGRPHNVTVLNDITESLEAEQALRSSEDKFARAFRASPDAISIGELESGRFLEVNEGFLRLSGYSREEVIGRTAAELGLWASPDARERLADEVRRNGAARNLPFKVQNRKGEQGEFLVSAEVVEIGGRSCLVVVSHDITEQVRAEQALRESEDKFAKAFIGSPQPLIITELGTGRYIDVNLGFEEVTGYKREEVIGRTSLEINIWDNLADRKELFRRLESEGKVRGMELVFRRKDGSRIITRCSFERIELAGLACMLSAIEDITEQRRSEEQLRQNQKLEALGTLAGGIAHDFNNILTAIIVNQELALMDLNEPADLGRRLEEIGLASNRAKELVRQILTFSRQQPHERLRQHLQMIIREALSLLRASLPSTIEISQDLSPEAPPVLTDASQIHQVVMNLCTNAAHAMRDQPGCLTVSLRPQEIDEAECRALPGLHPGRYARLTVTDTGHGMDASVLPRIFEPFFTTKGPGEGTGLGLPMVHGIMKDHGGGIFVESALGVGTTFDLYFPEATEAGLAAPVQESDIVFGHGESLLVVDDEEAICVAIGAMLRRIGYKVETFTDPRQGLVRFQSSPTEFNLLLTDRTMPHLSGPELIAQVHDWWPGLPALLMSGMTGTAPQFSSAQKGGYDLVEKPVDIADLSRAVHRALHPSPLS